jgi:hypothetical protein
MFNDVPVKERARLYKEAAGDLGSIRKKLGLFKDIYKGENVYIVSCGPSLATLDQDYLKEKLADFPVMTIKQAYGYVEGIVDVHHFNCNNFSRYQTENTVCIGSASRSLPQIQRDLWADADVDMFFQVDSRGGTGPKMLEKCEFDKHTYEASPKHRMWGPGTLFETTLWSAVHAGAKKISLIGVDLAPSDYNDNKTSYKHFYDTPGSSANIEGNKGILFKGENDMVREGFTEFHKWLASKDIELEVCSEGSHLSSEIPRNLWLYS